MRQKLETKLTITDAKGNRTPGQMEWTAMKNTSLRWVFGTAVLGLFLGLTVFSADLLADEDQTPRSTETQQVTYSKGFVPPDMDLSHLDGSKVSNKLSALATPSQWDWRKQGVVTSVKDQGACGSCYAFASIGNIESKIQVDGELAVSLSENNVKECQFYSNPCKGSSYFKVANWLSVAGTVLESCDPYVASDVSCNSRCTYQNTLLDWRIICWDEVPSIRVLQNYIYTYGPIYTTLYAGDGNDPSWDKKINSYDGTEILYYTGDYPVNHAVLIVGWDDTVSHAGGSGAWIVKNSWGTDWGGICGYGIETGYFKIAYGSAGIGKYSSFIHTLQDYNQHESIMYYDEGGWTHNLGYDATTAWMVAKYTLASNVDVKRVEFWTNDKTTDIDVYIYDTFDGTNLSDELACKLDQSFTEAGYHSVALDSPPNMTGGNTIYVAAKITNATYRKPIVGDMAGPAETNKTFFNRYGSGFSWTDPGSSYDIDLGLRIRTTPGLVTAVDDDNLTPFTFELSQNYPNPFNPTTEIRFDLPTASNVRLVVYNVLGQRVATLINGRREAGKHIAAWDATRHASGVYFYRLETPTNTNTRKMLLLK